MVSNRTRPLFQVGIAPKKSPKITNPKLLGSRPTCRSILEKLRDLSWSWPLTSTKLVTSPFPAESFRKLMWKRFSGRFSRRQQATCRRHAYPWQPAVHMCGVPQEPPQLFFCGVPFQVPYVQSHHFWCDCSWLASLSLWSRRCSHIPSCEQPCCAIGQLRCVCLVVDGRLHPKLLCLWAPRNSDFEPIHTVAGTCRSYQIPWLLRHLLNLPTCPIWI